MPVGVRWWTVVGGGPLGVLVSLIRRQRFPGSYLALYAADAAPGAVAQSIVEMADAQLPTYEGRAHGQLVGDLLTIQVDGRNVTVDVRRRDTDVRAAPRW